MSPADQDLSRVVKEGVLPGTVAQKYLTLYLGEADWLQHIDAVWARLQRRNDRVTKEELVGLMRRAIACAVLLPTYDKTKLNFERPEELLNRVPFWDQYRERDWFQELRKVIARDIQIQGWRNQALHLGVIDPLEYAPYTRQAFNWLYEKAVDTGCVNDANKDDVSRRHANMVKVYGGACITNVFVKHQELVKKVLNWRSGYFFEHTIFDVYSPEDVMKIKRMELAKTNSKLVKRVQVEA